MLWTDFGDFERFWGPWDEFDRMHRALSRLDLRRSSEFPSVNMWVSSDDSVVTTEIPGVDPDNIDISVTGSTVTLRGVGKPDDLQQDHSYHRRQWWQCEWS